METQLNFMNVVPIFKSNPEFAISEIRRQFKDIGIQRFALSLSCAPIGYPARDTVLPLLNYARQIMDGVSDLSVEMGILIQSTLGHGWSGPVPLTDEPWQRTVSIDGNVSSRMCPSDLDFRQYVLFVVGEIMKLNPKFLLLDDDFGLRHGECFCPNHVKLFNDEAARQFGSKEKSAAEIAEMIRTCPVDAPEVVLFSEQRKKLILDFASEIRKVIDAYNPFISCILCCPFNGHYFTNEAIRILAGEHGIPSARVNNAIYGSNQPLNLYGIASQTEMIKFNLPNAAHIVDEADTFPQTYYSENACLFHSHLTNAILCGLNGAKLWMSEFDQPSATGSQQKYEQIFALHQGFYRTLADMVQHTSWKGVMHRLTRHDYLSHPLKGSQNLYGYDWLKTAIGPFAFPIAYDDGNADGIFTLCENSADTLSDDDIMKLFSKKLLIDAKAAKILTRRGFAEFMGVQTVDDPMFFFQSEFADGMTSPSSLMWNSGMAKLELVNDSAKVMSWLCSSGSRDAVIDKIAPSMVFFNNSLGGRVVVVAWNPDMEWYKLWKNKRREFLMDAITFLNGNTPLDMILDAKQQVLVKHGILDDNTEWTALISLSLDEIPEIRLTRHEAVHGVTQLMPDGQWQNVPFSFAKGVLVVSLPLKVASPVILKFS